MTSLKVFREIEPWKKPYHVAIALLAKVYLKFLPNTKVIAITGSVGKTLTQNAIYSVLSQKYKVTVGDENLDPTFRIPKTILRAKPWDDYLILEYGVEHPGDMDYYLTLAKPKIAILTNISPTHLKYFKNEQGILREKSKLITALSAYDTAILNADDLFQRQMHSKTKAAILYFGHKANKGVKISHFSQNLNGSKFRLHYQGQKASASWKIVGYHQLLGAYTAATVGVVCGLTLKQIAKGLSQTNVPVHRLNLIRSKYGHIIDDTYNSSPAAASESINTVVDLGRRKLKIVVLGEMKDLGNLSKNLHKQLGVKIAKTNINYLITVGNVAKIISDSAKAAKFGGKVINVTNTGLVATQIKKITKANALILIKGSRHAHLERIVYALEGRSSQISCYHCGSLT